MESMTAQMTAVACMAGSDDPCKVSVQNGKGGLYSQIRCGKRHPFAKKNILRKVTVCEHLELERLPADQVLALADALPLYKNLKSLTLKTFRC